MELKVRLVLTVTVEDPQDAEAMRAAAQRLLFLAAVETIRASVDWDMGRRRPDRPA